MVVFGQKRLYSGRSSSIWAKVVLFLQKWFYSGKSGSILATSGCNRAKRLFSGKSGFIWAKVILFGQKWLCSTGWLYSVNVFVFDQMWLYSEIGVVLGQSG